jgi:hypothetical protein
MKLSTLLICTLFLLATVSGASAAPTPEAAPGAADALSRIFLPVVSKVWPNPQKGIGYVSWWPGEYSHPDSDLSLANLRATGATWISLLVTWYQGAYSSTAIDADASTPTDADLAHAIATAHRLGLKVMLKPHVDLANDPDHWRGDISFDSEAEWAAWFDSYRSFIYHYADLAQSNGVEQLCVGCELIATDGRESEWRQTVAGVRSRFSGPLVYASNQGVEVYVRWWDALDHIGVDAYYELTTKNDPTVQELKAAWIPYMSMLTNLANQWGKRILFTEIGYPSKDGANQRPYDYWTPGKVDLQEQADCYRAVFETFYAQPWFAGVYWQDWSVDPFFGSECDTGYTPHGKPAEDVLRAWYGAPQRPAPLPTPQPGQGQPMNLYTDQLSPGWQDWSWSADVALDATDQVHLGAHAIRVTLYSYGALSLWHPAFATNGYQWLEFYIRGSPAAEPELDAFFWDAGGTELRKRWVNDCRYVEGGSIEAQAWKRVIIPLSHLDAEGRSLSQIAIQDRSGRASTTFWIDEIRLLGNTPTLSPALLGAQTLR